MPWFTSRHAAFSVTIQWNRNPGELPDKSLFRLVRLPPIGTAQRTKQGPNLGNSAWLFPHPSSHSRLPTWAVTRI